jgi:hypothetical protein
MGLGPEKKTNWININNLLVKEGLTSEILEKMSSKSNNSMPCFSDDYGPPKCRHFDDNNDGYCDCCDYELE